MNKKFIAIIIAVIVLAWGSWFYVSGQQVGSLSQMAGVTNGTAPQSSTPDKVASSPQTLRIPSIGVNASIESVGMDAKQRMGVPSNYSDVAWYNLGYRPGEHGSAVISGHLDNRDGSPAVFWDIENLKKGDEITITDTNGSAWTFHVSHIEKYDWNQVPLEQIFNSKGKQTLSLITCEGTFNQASHNYSQRTVVYAEIE